MRKLVIAALALVVAAPVAAQNYVRGHYRSDGSYVSPHYRSQPDSSRYNNYSSQGNVNPYTGQVGTRSPYQQTPAYQPYRTPRRGTFGY